MRVFGTHKWLINSVNGMHFGGHQSMCLFVSELNTQINKNNNGFEHFSKGHGKLEKFMEKVMELEKPKRISTLAK